ncbi:MAG: UDP-2,3-diacylglucosamine diphosphatase [Prolixibacteraceae bacterium]|nr:UDP-2,3-diacylglucosamine diphosphatase [Prolixibacteraceae bacterium]
MVKKRTYFISDVHLGAPALKNNREREKLFVNCLEKIAEDADAIYLLGDIFDYWYEYKKVVPRGFVRTLGKIAEITDRGIPVHFFTGNHDVWVFDYLPEEIGIIVHREPYEVTINNKTFFLAHGDGLDPKEKGYLFLKKLFTSKTAQFLFSRLHPNFAFWLGHNWSKHSRISKGLEPEKSTGLENETVVTFAKRYCEKNEIDYFIFGHRHILLNEEIKPNTKVMILGEWINYFSYAVFDGKNLELKKFTN